MFCGCESLLERGMEIGHLDGLQVGGGRLMSGACEVVSRAPLPHEVSTGRRCATTHDSRCNEVR